jgi:LmbE family N-acetylglucosaminyl deacetylase
LFVAVAMAIANGLGATGGSNGTFTETRIKLAFINEDTGAPLADNLGKYLAENAQIVQIKNTDEEMQGVRRIEQRKAAVVGGYSAQIQLDYTSSAVKDPKQKGVQEDLVTILRATRPRVVYLHNLADKHDTHVAVTLRALAALRAIDDDARPKRVYGCEVWRDLDWLVDTEKQALPVSTYPNLAAALVGIFDSQVSGGKRYDLAIAGRRLANATFLASHETDEETAVTYAMDLTPLVADPSLSITDYVAGFVERMGKEVQARISKFS